MFDIPHTMTSGKREPQAGHLHYFGLWASCHWYRVQVVRAPIFRALTFPRLPIHPDSQFSSEIHSGSFVVHLHRREYIILPGHMVSIRTRINEAQVNYAEF